MNPDKNLRNVVDDLKQTPVGSHDAQQMNQQRNDRRKQTLKATRGHDEDVISHD